LVDDEAVADFRLLLKLSYGSSYIEDDGAPMPKATRLRLLVLANTFAFEECIVEVLHSLGEDLNDLPLAEVITYLDEIPEEVRGHEALGAVKVKVVKGLSKCIEKLVEEEEDLDMTKEEIKEAQKEMKQAGNALAKALGQVCKLFEPGDVVDYSDEGAFFQRVPLKEHVLDLPPSVMAVLLQSDDLQIQTENETFTLLCSWIYQSHHVEDDEDDEEEEDEAKNDEHVSEHAETLFRRLSPLINYQNISAEYFGAVISCCPLVTHTETLPYIIRSHIFCSGGRGNKNIAVKKWTFTSTIALDDLIGLSKGDDVYKYLAIAAGFPVDINIEHSADDTLGVYIGVRMPDNELEEGQERCVKFRCRVRLGGVDKTLHHKYMDGQLWGWKTFIQKPWEEVVHEGSPFFPNGECPVVVTMELLNPAGDEEDEERGGE
jgi:hypothetical protein